MRNKTVDLDTNSLLYNTCSKDKRQYVYNTMRDINDKNIHEVFRYREFKNDFVSRVSCFRNDKELIGFIRPSYDLFLEKLKSDLNVKLNCNDDKVLLNKVKDLEAIRDEYTLKDKFPVIYDRLQDGRGYIKEINKEKKSLELQLSLDPDNNDLIDKLEDVKKQEKYYYRCAMKSKLSNYINTQKEMYRRFITDKDKLNDLYNKTSFNKLFTNYLDLDRMYMFIINEYLVKIENIKDKKEIKKYIDLIDKYLDSSRNKNVEIISNKKEINIENINIRLNNAKRRVDDNSSEVDWIIIPEGHALPKAYKDSAPKETLLNMDELDKLRKIGEGKTSFYEGTNYLIRAVGLRKYRGYVAYIYPNGKVILDREYNKDSPSSALGNAIYVMDASNFEVLSKLDKTTLRSSNDVERLIHSGSWTDRAKKIIEEETSPKEEESAKTLVKKLKENTK